MEINRDWPQWSWWHLHPKDIWSECCWTTAFCPQSPAWASSRSNPYADSPHLSWFNKFYSIYQWCLSNSVAPHRHLQHLRSASCALQLNLCHACKEDIVLFDNSPVTCQVDLLPLGWTHLPSVAWKLCFDMKSGMSSQRKCPTFSIWQCCCDRGRTLLSFLNNGSDQTEINGALNRFGRWKKLYLHYTLSIFLIRFFLKDNVIICSVLRWWKCGGSFAALTAKQHSIKQLK